MRAFIVLYAKREKMRKKGEEEHRNGGQNIKEEVEL